MATTHTVDKARVTFEGQRVTLVRWTAQADDLGGVGEEAIGLSSIDIGGPDTTKRILSIGFFWSFGVNPSHQISIHPKGDAAKPITLIRNTGDTDGSDSDFYQPEQPFILLPSDALSISTDLVSFAVHHITVWYIEI